LKSCRQADAWLCFSIAAGRGALLALKEEKSLRVVRRTKDVPHYFSEELMEQQIQQIVNFAIGTVKGLGDAAKSTLTTLEAEVKTLVDKGAAASDENAQKIRANANELVSRVTTIVNDAVNNLNEVTAQAQKLVQETIAKVKPADK